MAPQRLRVSTRDVVVALAAFGLTLALLGSAHNADRGLDALGGFLAALACLPLVAHRRSPLGVFALTTAASAALNGLGYALGPPFGPTVALFYVAEDERTRARIAETAAVVLGFFAVHVAATAAAHGGFPTSSILFGVVIWGGAWVLGDQLQQRREPGHTGIDPGPGDDSAVSVDQRHVVMGLGPVDPTGQRHATVLALLLGGHRMSVRDGGGDLMDSAPRRGISQAVHDPGDRQGHRLRSDLCGVGGINGSDHLLAAHRRDCGRVGEISGTPAGPTGRVGPKPDPPIT